MSDVRLYEVGGCVRDDLLGIPSKDIDFAAEAESFDALRDHLNKNGFRIFKEDLPFFTIRARFPEGHKFAAQTADFVLCRKERGYSDGRHPDDVQIGTLYDDLARRDFTVNAIARSIDGEIIDPFEGQLDLERRVLRTVGRARDRFTEDALRSLRAIRFSITKNFTLLPDVLHALCSPWLPPLLDSVSTERKREEMNKAFSHDTLATMRLLCDLPPAFQKAVFGDDLWLKPTMEKR